jgi:hypothetical protein
MVKKLDQAALHLAVSILKQLIAVQAMMKS